ncbi:hypothetical protein [Taibaiella chishuiensis]|uniref:Response regulatory domain-containing protein n=1 Tax=Taibaiella chishuiensis TaxID=1434707 RepID=A0A2P8D777_9BACT|nr:hypothetical protein [Taibaiella chishuiensis]PSK93073.1 hypothetical protein B0I18_10242 [Taibaiella chishuiensis]
MLQKTEILYIGCNEAIRELVVRLINQEETWQGSGAGTGEEVALYLATTTPALVLLGNGLDETEEARLCAQIRTASPQTRIVQHYGGGSGLLKGEILQALSAGQV